MNEDMKSRVIAAHSSVKDGWCSVEKAIELAELVESNMPEVIVEVGIFSGKSLIPMAIPAKEYGAQVWGIDPWTVEACVEGSNSPETDQYWRNMKANGELERIRIDFLRDLERAGLSKTVRVLLAHDLNALSFFDDLSIGLLHLDSNHSPEVSRRSVEDWFRKIVPGGIFVMDDSDWKEQETAVAWLKTNPNLTMLADHGKHIVLRKNE